MCITGCRSSFSFFVAQLTDTMAFVFLTETDLFPSSASNSRELSSSYFDTRPMTVFHSPHAAVTDTVSTDVDVKYTALQSSPSIIALLNDKLDSQSKVATALSCFQSVFIVNIRSATFSNIIWLSV